MNSDEDFAHVICESEGDKMLSLLMMEGIDAMPTAVLKCHALVSWHIVHEHCQPLLRTSTRFHRAITGTC